MIKARKVMLLGDIGVGKSSLVRRLVHDRFEEDYAATIGVEISRYELRDGRSDLDLLLWDTDGNFGDAIFKHSYIKGAAAAIIVGDATRAPTLASIARLVQGFEEAMPGRLVSVILNKIDLLPPGASALSGLVPEGIEALPTSAKTGENVRGAISTIAASILRRGL